MAYEDVPYDRKLTLDWAKFEAYRSNLPRSFDENEIARHHEILGMLESATGEDLSAFRIPDSEMKPRVVSFSFAAHRRPGQVNMSKKRYCDSKLVQQQIDGILYYIRSLQPPQDKPKMGF